MQKLASALESVSRATGLTVRWFILAMVLLQFLIVITRYVFGYSSIAIQESVLYLHSTVFMIGAAYTLLVDGHVRVDIFYARMSPRSKRLVDLFGHCVLLIPSMLVILYWTWPSVRNSWQILEGPISVGGLPAVFLLKTLIPAFCVLLVIQSAACILRLLIQSESTR